MCISLRKLHLRRAAWPSVPRILWGCKAVRELRLVRDFRSGDCLMVANLQNGVMFIRLLFFLLVALSGAGLTIQTAATSRLRTATGSPVLTTMISVLVTLFSLSLVWASGATSRGSIPSFNSIPKWAWLGGLFGTYSSLHRSWPCQGWAHWRCFRWWWQAK